MKVAITFLALVALGYSAPKPKALFHEHFEEFLDIIMEESGPELDSLITQYLEYDEFLVSLDYLVTSNFRNLVYEIEDLPEFKAVVQFLEGHNIDIVYFIDIINEAVDSIQRRSLRVESSGRDMTAFIQDSIANFPKDKLTALFEKKMEENEEFKAAMESFVSEEWNKIYSALWENEIFLAEVAILKENGINVDVLLDELKAVLGIF